MCFTNGTYFKLLVIFMIEAGGEGGVAENVDWKIWKLQRIFSEIHYLQMASEKGHPTYISVF